MLSMSSPCDAAQRIRTAPPTRPTDDLRQDMLVWAEPIIADCIADAYKGSGLGLAYCGLLTTQHRRLWRALILDRHQHAEAAREDLMRSATRAGLETEILQDVDDDVLEELMEIVLQRCRTSRESSKGFGLVLLAAASSLGAARPLLA